MPRRHNTIMHDRVALAAGASPLEKDLPINPISFLTLTLRLLNNGANAVPTLSNILAMVSDFSVLLDGKTLVGGSLADLAAMTYALWGSGPVLNPITKTDDNIIRLTTHIPFGRRAWMPDEGLPTSRKGDLTCRITPAAAFTGVDTLTVTLEARQILDQAPARFLKYTTNPKTPTAAGEHEADLLTGPDFLGVLFFGTTVPTAAATTASLARVRLKVDDVEQHLPESRWESLIGEWSTRRQFPPMPDEHVHMSDIAAAYSQFQDTSAPQRTVGWIGHYIYIDFDPVGDLSYRLITRGRSRCHFVITADVADAIRFLPVEIVPLTTEAQA